MIRKDRSSVVLSLADKLIHGEKTELPAQNVYSLVLMAEDFLDAIEKAGGAHLALTASHPVVDELGDALGRIEDDRL